MAKLTKADLEAKVAALEERNAQLERALKGAQVDAEIWQERYGKVATMQNELLSMLDTFFHFDVGAKTFDEETNEPLWDVKDTRTGDVLVSACEGLPAAYERAMTQQMRRSWPGMLTNLKKTHIDGPLEDKSDE